MARKRPSGSPSHPGRRPSQRPSPGASSRPEPRGFTGPGYRQVYDRLMPGLAGAEKRQYFNDVSAGVVVAAGIIGAGVGFACLGWIGGVLGVGAGISLGGSYVEKQRFYRR